MLVRALTAPASAGEFTWDDTEQVVEVPDAFGHDITHVAGGAVFAEVLPADVKPRRRKQIEE